MIHFNHANLASLGISVKVLFTAFLMTIGIGFLVAGVLVMETHGMSDGIPGLSVEDVVISYYGNKNELLLINKLNGSMKNNATNNQRIRLIDWAIHEPNKDNFEKVRDIYENTCQMCHNPHSGLPDFTKFENIEKTITPDKGMSYSRLAKLSHVHLFGISFIFFFVGGIFTLATGIPFWLKSWAISMPFLFLILDVSGWWATRIVPEFAYMVMFGGAGMALAFSFMFIVSIWEMWGLPLIRNDERDGLHDE